MKILVFSDSHGYCSGMERMIRKHSPDQVIHLGDLMEDAQTVAMDHSRLPFCMVPGNCDGWLPNPLVRQLDLEGKQILLAHGHTWNVKQGYETAIAAAHQHNADVLLFGHTHIPLCRQLEDGLWMMNPGTARSTYGIITIENGALSCQVCPID